MAQDTLLQPSAPPASMAKRQDLFSQFYGSAPAQLDLEHELIPYPQRLLSGPLMNASGEKRRVRPIPVAPPPGFEGDAPLDFGLNRLSLNQSGFAHGRSCGIQEAVLRGALAGDWSEGRPMPDVPSFVFSRFVREEFESTFNQNSFSGLQSSAAYPSVEKFLRNESSVQRNPTDRTNSIPMHLRSRLDSRLTAPVSSDSGVKRRLMPSKVSNDYFGVSGASKWSAEVTQLLTPYKAQNENVETGFERTPKAPKGISAVVAPNAETNDVAREVELFKSQNGIGQQANQGQEFTYFSSPVIPSAETNLAEKKENVVPVGPVFCDGDFTTANASDKISRKKIPPPPQSSPERRLQQRQKQVDIGKNTPEYQYYIYTVPKEQRRKGDPQTPDKFQDISKRNWEGQVKAWRRRLHEFDPPQEFLNELIKKQEAYQSHEASEQNDPKSVEEIKSALEEEMEMIFPVDN
ncbi:hypothetical protein MP638_004241 [Amoeboaphelidium occidentale]|nr:hypothetical protein MP638_004241 [Amoeboaphelidium occidentale]